ncbi:MAG: MFS transporter [Betaproteobacteria bacterium]|nr:MFS transporter [Betaproteobacteria bacterium]
MKIFHGWRLVGAGAALQVLQGGLMQQSFGAYVAVLSDERDWSKTALSGGAAMMSLETAIIGPLVGWLVDRFGESPVIRAGVLLFALGLIALGMVDSIIGFYAAIALCSVGMTLCGYLAINVAIIHWFERYRARALSAVGLGVGFGGILVPVVAAFMQAFGWRATAIASGCLVLLVGWPLGSVFRGRPQQAGEYVDGIAPNAAQALPYAGSEPAASRAVSGPQVAEAERALARSPADTLALSAADEARRGFTLHEAMRTRAFWLLALGHGAALLVVGAVNVHAITHMKEGLGYSVNAASLIIMIMTLAQIGGVLLGIWIGDRFIKRRIAALAMLGHFLGLLMLTYASGTAMLVAFAVLHGAAWGVRGPFMQAIRADYFGRRAIGTILGMSSVVVAIGQVAGPLVAGVLADLMGDYRLGFTVLALVSLAGAWAFVAAVQPLHPALDERGPRAA